jgi:hypothetical protein
MSSVQTARDNANKPFVLLSSPGQRQNGQTLLTDAGRTTDLLQYTLMAKVAATQKWVPFTDETATNGAAIPQGIYVGGDIASADIVAGDVEGLSILVGDANFDENQLVIENSKTLDTVITVGTTDLRTVRDHLATRGLFSEDTIAISSAENA